VEHSSPKGYPRAISKERQKPIKHVSVANNKSAVAKCATPNSWSGGSVEITVVEECASIQLIPSWGSPLVIPNSSCTNAVQLSYKPPFFPQGLTSDGIHVPPPKSSNVQNDGGLTLELFPGELRREVLVIENMSPSLQVI
jgi:hypothetical protein